MSCPTSTKESIIKRLLTIIALASALAVSTGTAPAQADTAVQAQDRAQIHVQDPGCGDGTTWICSWSSYIYQFCHWNYSGNGFWDCNGFSSEYHGPVNYSCQWYVHIRDNAIFFWHDICRNRYGTSRLG